MHGITSIDFLTGCVVIQESRIRHCPCGKVLFQDIDLAAHLLGLSLADMLPASGCLRHSGDGQEPSDDCRAAHFSDSQFGQ